jgi:SHS2 domain-containing protein
VSDGEKRPTPGEPARGHRGIDHTADEILEAWGPTRAACLEEAVHGFVALFARLRPGATGRPTVLTLDADDLDELLLAALEEVILLLEVEDVVPVRVVVEDLGQQVALHLELADVADAAPAGPAPKAISRSGLRFAPDGATWRARAIVDI